MGYEIERRFLTLNDDWRELVEYEQFIKQGYLAKSHGNTLRVRSIREKEDVYYLLEGKGARQGLQVREPYVILAPDEYREFAALCGDRWIAKRRSVIEGLVPYIEFHIDDFCGRHAPLIIIEAEFIDMAEEEAQKFADFPDWVGEEITDWPDIANFELAEKGLPEYMRNFLLEQLNVA